MGGFSDPARERGHGLTCCSGGAEIVNGMAETQAGYRVRNRGSRAIELEIRPQATLPADARLVRPAVTEA